MYRMNIFQMPVFQALKASISNVDTGTASRQEMSSKLLGVDRKALETDPREASGCAVRHGGPERH